MNKIPIEDIVKINYMPKMSEALKEAIQNWEMVSFYLSNSFHCDPPQFIKDSLGDDPITTHPYSLIIDHLRPEANRLIDKVLEELKKMNYSKNELNKFYRFANRVYPVSGTPIVETFCTELRKRFNAPKSLVTILGIEF